MYVFDAKVATGRTFYVPTETLAKIVAASLRKVWPSRFWDYADKPTGY